MRVETARDRAATPAGNRVAGAPVVERNRYFTGKFMTARDLAGEQDYFVHKHRLHNRLYHGWGVVCGFGVTPHPRDDCENWIVVGPGVALDCHGRELVSKAVVPIEVTIPPDLAPTPANGENADSGRANLEQDSEAGSEDGDGPNDVGPEGSYRLLLCARYVEHEVERVPVVYGDCDGDPQREEANRIREAVELELLPFEDFDAACWQQPGGGESRCYDDCDEELPALGGGCIESECPCGGSVPLALITVGADGKVAEPEVDGRRNVLQAVDQLTHITRTSWEHGSSMSIEELRDSGTLEITFDRKIADADGIATGINPETFVVQHAGESDGVEFVPYDPERPPCLDGDHKAVFAIDRTFLRRGRRGGLVDSIFYVTLYGDFVADCHGNAIDADHLGGRLPSGNGVQGGTFRSWFRIGTDTDDEEDE